MRATPPNLWGAARSWTQTRLQANRHSPKRGTGGFTFLSLALNAPNDNGHPVHADSCVSKGLPPTYGLPPSQGTPYPSSDALWGAPRSNYPLATFVDPESPNDQVSSPFGPFAHPGVVNTHHNSQAAADLYTSEIGTPMPPLAATPAPAPTHHDVPDYAPLDNGCTAFLIASLGNERDGLVSPPPIAYPQVPASSLHPAALTPYPVSDNAWAHGSTITSGSLAHALGNYCTQPPSASLRDADGAAPSAADSTRSRQPINASMSMQEVNWQMAPGPGRVPVADQTIIAFTGERFGADANVNAHASCLGAVCIPTEADYAQGFDQSCWTLDVLGYRLIRTLGCVT